MQVLRPYQSEDFQRIRVEASSLKKANRRVAILYVLACGGGKTTVISHLVMMVNKKGNHTLFLVRKEELLDQGKNRLEEHDIKAGVIKSGRMLQIDKSVYVCSTPTLVNRFKNANPEMKMWNPRGDVIIIDECFPAGVRISGRKIEDLKVGDFVESFNLDVQLLEWKPVTKLFKNPMRSMVTVRLSNGQKISCTPGHPFFSNGAWVDAINLKKGDNIYVKSRSRNLCDLYEKDSQRNRSRKGSFSLGIRLSAMFGFLCRSPCASKVPTQISSIFSSNEHIQSNEESGIKRSNESGAFQNRTQASSAWWKWKAPIKGLRTIVWCIRNAARNCSTNKNETWKRVSKLLQIGYWRFRIETWNRSRWCQSWPAITPDSRQEEGGSLAKLWVDNIEIQESGSDGRFGGLCPDRQCYNIEVEGNNNYFADGILVHNCHEAISPTTLKVLEQYPEAMIIGITATPQRTDGKGLGVSVGGIFESMIVGPSPRALIQMGFLVPYRLFEPPITFDFSGVSITAKGEYNDRAAAAVVDKPDLIGDVHKNWSLHAADRKTIIFAQGRDHGKHILKDFLDKGVVAVYVDGDNSYTSKEKRLAVPRDFKNGKYQVVINVNVYTQGVDFPFCDCVVIARGTASLIFWIQMTGRGLRTNPGKSDVIIIDHAGNAKFRFGLPDHEHEWSLEGRRKKNKPKIPSLHTCEVCFALFRSNIHTCPECGYCWWNVAERGELPSVADAILVEHTIQTQPTKKQLAADALEEQKIFLAEMVLKQVSNSYKFKFALTKFKERYGAWPKKKHGVNIEWVTTDETLPGTERFKMKIIAWELNGNRYSDPVMDDLPEAVG